MEETLKALGVLLIESIPTIVFFIFLTWYLNRIYFRPVGAMLEERRKATEGVRDLAQKASEAADRKQSEFEKALELARGELYQENEKLRQQWAEEQTNAIAKARAEADEKIMAAKRDIAAEAERVQNELNGQVEPLSEAIVEAVLRQRAA